MKKIKYKSIGIERTFNGKSGQQLVAVDDQKILSRELAQELEQVTGIPLIRTMSVLAGLSELIGKKLAEGYTVKIDGLGTFRNGLSMEKEDPVIKKVNFIPASEVKAILQKARFEKVES